MSQRKFERQSRQRTEAEQRRRTRRARAGIAAGAVGAAVMLSPAAASAADFQVDKNTDAAPGGACDAAIADDCSLRDAVELANNAATADVITFQAGLTSPIALTEGQLQLNTTNGDLTIQGPGADDLTISGTDQSRIFSVTGSGSATISGLTLTDGDGSPAAGTADGKSPGGAVSNAARLQLVDTVITGNTAPSGGGLASVGRSGPVSPETTLTRTKVEDNDALSGPGGGIESRSPLTLTDSSVTGNTSTSSGGGIAHRAGKYVDVSGPGNLTITGSDVDGNDAADGGGGLFVDYTEEKYEGGDVSITRSTFNLNTAETAGGGIAAQNFSDDNDFRMATSTVSRNTVEEEVLTRATPLSGTGGGIDFNNMSASATSVTNSTVANNGAATGGGINVRGPVEVPVPAARAEAAAPSLNVDNTTVAANTAANTGGGVAVTGQGTNADGVGLNSTIVGDNTSGDANKDVATPGQGVLSTYSLIEVKGGATVATTADKPTIFGQDPKLAALANNGGPTETKLPATSSPAIDQGSALGLTGDQRAFKRTQDRPPANASDGTDVGAVEIPAEPPQQPGQPPAEPAEPLTPSQTPTVCGRRAISLVRADVKGRRVVLKGLVGSRLYGKKVTIQTDPKGARSSAFTRTTTVTASSKTGSFTASVPKPAKDDLVSVRYRAVSGSSRSPALKLPQSLTSRSVKSAKGTITVKGRVKKSVLGKRNRVKIRRLVCGRYRTVGTAKPDENGNYKITFESTQLRGVAFYRAESKVLRKPGSKVYVIQYARAIAIRTTPQTG